MLRAHDIECTSSQSSPLHALRKLVPFCRFRSRSARAGVLYLRLWLEQCTDVDGSCDLSLDEGVQEDGVDSTGDKGFAAACSSAMEKRKEEGLAHAMKTLATTAHDGFVALGCAIAESTPQKTRPKLTAEEGLVHSSDAALTLFTTWARMKEVLQIERQNNAPDSTTLSVLKNNIAQITAVLNKDK